MKIILPTLFCSILLAVSSTTCFAEDDGIPKFDDEYRYFDTSRNLLSGKVIEVFKGNDGITVLTIRPSDGGSDFTSVFEPKHEN